MTKDPPDTRVTMKYDTQTYKFKHSFVHVHKSLSWAYISFYTQIVHCRLVYNLWTVDKQRKKLLAVCETAHGVHQALSNYCTKHIISYGGMSPAN